MIRAAIWNLTFHESSEGIKPPLQQSAFNAERHANGSQTPFIPAEYSVETLVMLLGRPAILTE
jgi:hypothetical protein